MSQVIKIAADITGEPQNIRKKLKHNVCAIEINK
jgi:hypothetical protein